MTYRLSQKSASVKAAANLIQKTNKVVVLTGAGISTPSGIPDFRSAEDGLWNKIDPMEVASLLAFRHHPEKFYQWLQPLVRNMFEALPNPAHFALSQLEEAGYISAIITQNIDGLHQRAGSKTVHEVHGTLQTLTCVSCYRQYPSREFLGPYLAEGGAPICPDCHGVLKPDAILIGEQLPHATWQAALKATRRCEVLLVIGSSLEVVPVASLPAIAVDSGAKLIVVNHTPTYIDERAEVVLDCDVVEALPLIADEVLR